MSRWSGIGAWALVGLIALNAAGTGYYFILKSQLEKTRQPPVVDAGSEFPKFSGVDVLGEKWKSRDAPCRVIRITDDHCAYCKKDKQAYSEFLDAARRATCEIIEMSPKAGQMAHDPRPEVVQIKYIDTDLGSVLAPFATPQTVILDAEWSLRWSRRGIFDEKSLASSVALLGSLGD